MIDELDVPGVRRRWPETAPTVVIDTQVSPVSVAARVSTAVAVAAAYPGAGARGLELAPRRRRRRITAAAAAAIVALEERAARVALVERRAGKSAGVVGFPSRQHHGNHQINQPFQRRRRLGRTAGAKGRQQPMPVGQVNSDPALA